DSSRDVRAGSLFVAVRGSQHDGHRYIDDAIRAGATSVIAECAPPANLSPEIAWLHVPDSRRALAAAASLINGEPWRGLKLAGVTGTNGKTTCAYLIHHIMKSVWHRAGMIGTIAIDDGLSTQPAGSTTPGAIELSNYLRVMGENGCRGAVMEVSSHGIHQQRVAETGFDVCVFTNLTQDHLDYHETLENYWQTKASWFREVAKNPRGKKPVAVINTDDSRGLDLADELDAQLPVIRYGFNVHCDFRANNLRQSPRGMEFELNARGRSHLVRAPFIGRFNAYNLLAALAASISCGIRPREAIAALAESPQVPGRMQQVGNAGGATVFIDYAHTADALENACRTLRELNPRRLITVFGCGGDRDAGKRPKMGAAAASLSDACIITSDNPRSEDPAAIIREIEKGMPKKGHLVIPDRAEAIHHAITHALSGDIILIAGKGHETTQQLATKTVPFDDRKQAAKALRERAATIAQNR
ncbi:MAG: UDP-N-acetylmuramoyl-L-alanyl-D-glutamate--2,6-diaminopimelate ligase, partial [Luteolibacter sp.]